MRSLQSGIPLWEDLTDWWGHPGFVCSLGTPPIAVVTRIATYAGETVGIVITIKRVVDFARVPACPGL